MKKSLEESLLEQPIPVPPNPFMEAIKEFGSDEAIAGLINIGATAAIEKAVSSNLVKSVAGPVMEKFGFFVRHIYDAKKIYSSTPKEVRKPFIHYFNEGVKKGMKSLALDIAVHDPIYVGLMYGGLTISPQTPAWMLAGTSFLLAVGVAAGVDVGIAHGRYKFLEKKLKEVGFGKESYIESRFCLDSSVKPEEVLTTFKNKFDLSEIISNKYHDVYFPENNLPELAGRTPKVRLRKRQDGDKWVQTAQIVYTKATPLAKKQEQFSYFPISKDKFYLELKGDMPSSMKEINEGRANGYLTKNVSAQESKVLDFERKYVKGNNQGLFVSVDKVNNGERNWYVAEIKVREDKKLLVEAMRYLMYKFPVIQVTQGKVDLAEKFV